MRHITKSYSMRPLVHAVVSAVFYYAFFNGSSSVVLAGPEGAEVIHGRVSFQKNGLNTVITASDKSIVNYKSFDIARPEAVKFVQPHSNASVLNRINSANPTHIDGTLSANGRVFFVNPAGVYIGNDARINVNQLVASGLDISNSDFINGKYHFSGGKGSVENRGNITAEKVHLIGKQVANYGTINCPGGYVVMAAGDRVFLGKPGNDLTVQVDPEPLPESTDLDMGVRNDGTINAAGGQIVLAAAGDIYSQAISNVGTLSASVQDGDAGNVKLVAKKGNINNRGSIKSTSKSGRGGKVTTEGNEVINSGTVDVTGSEGGQVTMKGKRVGQFGTVHADGTNSHGGNVTMTADEVVTLGSDSLTTANAGLNGNGGDVTVFSNDSALFWPDAKIEAKGGSESGDGGFVELSAEENVYAYGLVDTSAKNGTPGNFLIDPRDITIRDDNASDGVTHTQDYDGSHEPNFPTIFPDYSNTGLAFQTSDSYFNDNEFANEVASGYIDSILETGSNVILQATRDISIDPIVNNPIVWDTSADLILQAGKNITFTGGEDSSIIGSTGGGSIHLEADSPHNGDDSGGDRTGTLTVGNNVTLSTDTGDITLIGAKFDIFGEIDAGSGNINISQSQPNRALHLGSGGTLTNDDLDKMTTTGTLTIGQATTGGTDGAGNEAVTITAGDITLSELILGDKNVALVSNGRIDDWDNVNDNITTSGTLTLTSGGAIGGLSDPNNPDGLSTNVGTLAVTTTGGNDIKITDSGRGGDTTYSNILTGGAGNIDIAQTAGNLIAGTMTTTGDINLSVQGDVTQSGKITADKLTVDTGGAPPAKGVIVLDTQNNETMTINMISGNDKDINYKDSDSINIELVSAGGGDVTITAGGAIRDAVDDQYEPDFDIIGNEINLTSHQGGIGMPFLVEQNDGPVTENRVLEITAAREFSANTSGEGTDILIYSHGDLPVGSVDAGADSVTLYSTGAIRDAVDDSSEPDVDVVGDTINLTADSGGIGTPASVMDDDVEIFQDGVLEVTARRELNADTTTDGGDILISSLGDLPIGFVDASWVGDVTFDSSGAIRDATDDSVEPTVDIIGHDIELTAKSGGIGTPVAGPIESVAEDRSLEIETFDGGLSANTAADGADILSSIDASNLRINLVDAGTGNVTLEATGGIHGNPDGIADVIGGVVDLWASRNIWYVEVAVAQEFNASAEDDIVIESVGDLPVGLVQSNHGFIEVHSSGAIKEAGDDPDAEFITGTLMLFAATGITGDPAIETSVRTLRAETESGDIVIVEQDDVLLADILANNGSIFLEVINGAMTYGIKHAQEKMIKAMTGIALESSGNITTYNKLETNEGNISIHSKYGDLIINGNVTASKGGVSLVTDTGKIYTEPSDDDSAHLDQSLPSLNAQIIGYSDQAGDIGVGLPFDENQKAAIVVSSIENLKLGTGAILSANGAYDPTIYDDLAAVNFEGGDPIDVAIYVGSYDFESQTGGNVTVDSAVDIASGGTMVIDAENTVMPFSNTFTDSWKKNNANTNRLEVVSRATETLNQAVDLGTLPYADQVIQGKYPDWLGDSEYVLRGKRAAEVFLSEAEVPHSIEAAPINYLNDEDEKYVSLHTAAEFIEEPEPLQLLVIRDGKYVKAQRNMVLKRGDEIKTPRDMTAFIHFEDGSEIIMMPDTDIVIENPTIFTKLGKIFARVRAKFKVRTKYVTAGVKGTLFVVDVGEDGIITIKVIEGNIALDPDPNVPIESRWPSVSLGPGKQVRIRNRQEPQIELIRMSEYEQIVRSITALEQDIAEIPKVTEGIAVLRDFKFGGIEGTVKDDYTLFDVWH